MSGAVSIDKDLALELAYAEIKRLRTRPVGSGAQQSLPGVTDELVAEAAQAAVELRLAASRLANRAPREAVRLRGRADRLQKVLGRVR